MNTVMADAASGTATIGAGAKLIDVYAGLAASGVSVPGGSCPTVGIAGLALGGGVGVTGRRYGLTSDNLVSAEVVVPNGSVLTCDATREPDLFWACRGGGGGNFGVVSSLTFRTHPIGDIVLFYLTWPWERAVEVVRGWQGWAPNAPDELWSNCHLLANPSGSAPTLSVGGTYLGDESTADQLIDRLTAAIGVSPSGRSVETTSFAHAMGVEAGCASESTAECHLPWQNPAGRLAREAELAASDFFTGPLNDAAIAVITSAVERRRALGGDGDGGIAFDAFGGALNRPAPDATAFVHRDTLFLAQYTTTSPTSVTSGCSSWLTGFHTAMRPYASGQAYQNYADAGLAGWAQAYYGANYRRLTQVKARYDPGFILRPPQAIGTS
jgi:FAD/FMN-containing dehydrogenase